MKNYVQEGDTMTMTAPGGGVVSGSPYLIGALFGVAVVTATAGVDFELRVKGVFSDMPKATGEVWSKGDPLYWDATAGKLTKTAGNNLNVAVVAEAALTGDATGTVKINEAGAKVTGLTAPQAAIANLIDSTTGAADGTLADVGATFNQATLNNNFADLAAKVNAALAALRGANIITD